MKDGKTRPPVIIMIGPLAPPLGGMQTSLRNLADSVLHDRYDLCFWDTTGFRTRYGGTFSRGIFEQIKAFFKFIRLMARSKPDIAHVHLKGGFYFYRRLPEIMLSRLFGCKIILHVRGSDMIPFYEKGSFLAKILLRNVLGSADKVIALSNKWKDFLLGASPKANIIVIPNGVRISDFRMKEDMRQKLGFDAGTVMVLFLGGISRRKGTQDVLSLASKNKDRLDNIVFVISGAPDAAETDIPSREKLKLFGEAVKKDNLQRHIRYIGEIRGQEKIDHLLSCDIFFSATYAENFPNVMLEAMAAGRPIVITDVGGVRDAMEDGINGFIVKPGGIDDMFEKLIMLARDPSLRKKMGEINFRLAADKYDMTIIADRIGSVYQEVLTRKTGR